MTRIQRIIADLICVNPFHQRYPRAISLQNILTTHQTDNIAPVSPSLARGTIGGGRMKLHYHQFSFLLPHTASEIRKLLRRAFLID